jgi:hypothetical protein
LQLLIYALRHAARQPVAATIALPAPKRPQRVSARNRSENYLARLALLRQSAGSSIGGPYLPTVGQLPISHSAKQKA